MYEPTQSHLNQRKLANSKLKMQYMCEKERGEVLTYLILPVLKEEKKKKTFFSFFLAFTLRQKKKMMMMSFCHCDFPKGMKKVLRRRMPVLNTCRIFFSKGFWLLVIVDLFSEHALTDTINALKSAKKLANNIKNAFHVWEGAGRSVDLFHPASSRRKEKNCLIFCFFCCIHIKAKKPCGKKMTDELLSSRFPKKDEEGFTEEDPGLKHL